jgi:hypothetical protein
LGKLPGFYKLHINQFQEWVIFTDPFHLKKLFVVSELHESLADKASKFSEFKDPEVYFPITESDPIKEWDKWYEFIL